MPEFEPLKVGYNGEFRFPRCFYRLARDIGGARWILNQKMTEENPEFDRGTQNKDTSILGVMGELLPRFYLTDCCGIVYESAPLIALKLVEGCVISLPQVGPDVWFGPWELDAKAVYRETDVLRVNVAAHIKKKMITHYWFFRLIEDCVAAHVVFRYDEVSKWEVKKWKTDAHYLPVEKMNDK